MEVKKKNKNTQLHHLQQQKKKKKKKKKKTPRWISDVIQHMYTGIFPLHEQTGNPFNLSTFFLKALPVSKWYTDIQNLHQREVYLSLTSLMSSSLINLVISTLALDTANSLVPEIYSQEKKSHVKKIASSWLCM